MKKGDIFKLGKKVITVGDISIVKQKIEEIRQEKDYLNLNKEKANNKYPTSHYDCTKILFSQNSYTEEIM